MIFKSADEFKWAVKYHEATRRKDIHFIKNEGRRVRVICRHSSICKWTIFASRSNPRSPFAVKTYCPEHTCGDQDENKTVNSVEAYLRAYEPAIQPILSSVLWPKSNLPDPLPPKYKAQPGRPKKKRKINPIEESKKGTTEMKTRKVGEVKRCTVCGVQGHNKKTCKGLNPQGTDMDEVIAGESDVGN
nr:uncharacterized protein LOC109163555 [Ipomoea batatas]